MSDANEQAAAERLSDEREAQSELETADRLAAAGRCEESLIHYVRASELSLDAGKATAEAWQRYAAANSVGGPGIRAAACIAAEEQGGLELWGLRLFFCVSPDSLAGRAERGWAAALYELGRNEESLVHYRRSVAPGAFGTTAADLPHYERVASLSMVAGDVEGEARARASWARTLDERGRHGDAANCFPRLAELCLAAGDTTDRVELELEWSDELYLSDRREEAAQHQEAAIDLLLKAADVASAARAVFAQAMGVSPGWIGKPSVFP